MKVFSYAPFLLPLLLAGALSAQEPVIAAETPIDQATLHQWLHSTDPRLIAWAADFAHRNHDAKIVAEMPELLEHWAMPPEYGGDETQAAQGRAVLAILDALIQEDTEVPVPAIAAIASSFPSQAAILIGRLPLSASRNTLDNWTYGAEGTWSGRTLPRLASMMLAKDPLPSTVVFGTNELGTDDISPGGERCIVIQSALKTIIHSILPKDERLSKYEVTVDSQSLSYSHQRGDRPDVGATIRILHRGPWDQPIDDCQERCLKDMQQALGELGAFEGAWRGANA